MLATDNTMESGSLYKITNQNHSKLTCPKRYWSKDLKLSAL